MKLPVQWHREKFDLRRTQIMQARKGYVPAKGEKVITEEDIDALDELPATAAEVAEIHKDSRGQYRKGDKRGFIAAHELACDRYNCWMTRAADGSPTYVSESPKPKAAKKRAVKKATRRAAKTASKRRR